MLMRGLFLSSMIALLGCGGTSASSECEGLSAAECMQPDAGIPDAGDPDASLPDGGAPPDGDLIVDTDWLAANLGNPMVQIVDARSSGYDASRIPGAIHLVPGDLSTTTDGVGGQLTPAMDAQPVLREAGLRNEVTVVVYGRSPEYDPARIVWSLAYYGHEDVRYLDGGFEAWVDAGGELDESAPDVAATEYTIVAVNEDLRVEGDWVLGQLGDAPYDMPAIQLVDARSSGEFASGRIPTALNVDWSRNLESGFLRDASELEALYPGFDSSKTTVTYCASGRRGAFAWLTLAALGYDDVRLYDGSWNEWGSGVFTVER